MRDIDPINLESQQAYEQHTSLNNQTPELDTECTGCNKPLYYHEVHAVAVANGPDDYDWSDDPYCLDCKEYWEAMGDLALDAFLDQEGE